MRPVAIKLNKRGQITLPAEIRTALVLSEKSQLSVVLEDGQIILTPIPEDQAWFWTKEWQKGEAEADEDIKNGNLKSFENINEAIENFHAED